MAAIAPSYLVGKNIKVKVDATEYPIKSWRASDAVGTFDATNSTSGGAMDPEATIESCNGSFVMVWKATAGSPAFAVGSIYALELIVKGTTKWACNALITSIDPDNDVSGGCTMTVNFASKGTITPPTGP